MSDYMARCRLYDGMIPFKDSSTDLASYGQSFHLRCYIIEGISQLLPEPPYPTLAPLDMGQQPTKSLKLLRTPIILRRTAVNLVRVSRTGEMRVESRQRAELPMAQHTLIPNAVPRVLGSPSPNLIVLSIPDKPLRVSDNVLLIASDDHLVDVAAVEATTTSTRFEV